MTDPRILVTRLCPEQISGYPISAQAQRRIVQRQNLRNIPSIYVSSDELLHLVDPIDLGLGREVSHFHSDVSRDGEVRALIQVDFLHVLHRGDEETGHRVLVDGGDGNGVGIGTGAYVRVRAYLEVVGGVGL